MPKLIWILRSRCPRCGEAPLFVHPNAYHLKRTAEMHGSCDACGEDFTREPGFYWCGLCELRAHGGHFFLSQNIRLAGKTLCED